MPILQYKVALVNVPWRENDINTRFFDSVEAQNAYFDTLTGGKLSPLVNFNMGNAINTEISWRDTTGQPIENLIGCNYACVFKYDNEGNIINRRYYFAYPSQDTGGQIRATLSLDDVQTNYFKYKNNIKPCNIKRAHLNRWVIGPTTSEFNFLDNSNLFLSEPTGENPKYLVQRSKLNWNFTNDNEVNEWLNNNIAYWVYVYIDGTIDEYKIVNYGGNNATVPGAILKISNDGVNTESVIQDYGAFCYPVFKDNLGYRPHIIVQTTSGDFEINKMGEKYFRDKNADSSYYFSKKISLVPPFYYKSSEISIVNNDLKINLVSAVATTSIRYLQDENNNPQCGLLLTHSTGNYGVFSAINQNKMFYESQPISFNNVNISYTNDFIKQNSNNLNPKLLNADNLSLKIKSYDGNEFNYDIQKTNNNTFVFEYSETLQPEVTKYYIRLKPSGLYKNGTNANYMGLVGSNDQTIAVTNDQYASFLANNKNFWLQTAFKSVLGIGEGIARGAIGGQKSGIISGAVQGVANGAINFIDKAISIDNLKASPDSLSNASGNVLLQMQIAELGFYVELHDTLPVLKQAQNDYNKQFGYSLNLIKQIGEVDNIRKYYNYIEADIEVIDAPINNEEKYRLIQTLKQIRFWNTDDFNLNLQNYERGLDNE